MWLQGHGSTSACNVIYSAVNYATVLATAPETSQSLTFLADLIFNGLQWLRADYQQRKASMFRQDAQGGVPEAGRVVVVGLAMYIVGKYMNYRFSSTPSVKKNKVHELLEIYCGPSSRKKIICQSTPSTEVS